MINEEDKPKSLKKIAPSGKVTISGRDEALENIKAYYEDDTGTVVLPPHQNDIRERWETIHGLILKGTLLSTIIRNVSELFEVSESTIRRDIPCVEEIWNSQTLSYSLRRQRAANIALKILKKAEKAGDLTNQNKALANLIKADGLENEPLDLPKTESHIYIIMPDPTTEALLRAAFPIQDGRINLNDLAQITQDIEYDDITAQNTPTAT
jgi:hypothetical protein